MSGSGAEDLKKEVPRSAAQAAAQLTLPLTGGAKMPALGLGTWMGRESKDPTTAAVKKALAVGYRHIDTAAIYGNESLVGQGIAESGVPRADIFLTTKLWNTHHAPDAVPKALDESLEKLKTNYVDLYLMHWPYADGNPDVTVEQTWAAMEKLVETGKAKHIGVSNFSKTRLDKLLKVAKIKPAVNQIELHPYLQQQEFVDWMKSNNIAVTAYMPFGNLNKFILEESTDLMIHDPTLIELAEKHKITVPQLCISWALTRGTSTIPKSITPERIISNFAFFELPSDTMQAIAKLDKQKRYIDPSKLWGQEMFV